MKLSSLLLPSLLPGWFKLSLTVGAALLVGVCTRQRAAFTTQIAWTVGYGVLLSLPWLAVRGLAVEHPLRVLQAKDRRLARRFWAYRDRGNLWFGLGMMGAEFVAQGLPNDRNAGGYTFGAVWAVWGVIAMVRWNTQRHSLPVAGET